MELDGATDGIGAAVVDAEGAVVGLCVVLTAAWPVDVADGNGSGVSVTGWDAVGGGDVVVAMGEETAPAAAVVIVSAV